MKCVLLLVAPIVFLSTALGADVAVPDSFTALVPLYPGAKVVIAVGTGNGTQVHLTSDSKAQEIVDFYRKAMTQKGWSEGAVVAVPDGVTAAFIKGDLALGIIALRPAGDKAYVTLSLTKE